MAKSSCVKDLKLLNPVCAVAAERGLHLDGRRVPAPPALACDCQAPPAPVQLDPERHGMTCAACGTSCGSVIDLVMAVDGVDLDGAKARLQARIDDRGLAQLPRQGIVLVDHGSRRADANEQLLDVAALLQARAPDAIVHVAHMEIAPPTIADAFAACVEDGAAEVVVHPYFLAPGAHAMADIPAQAQAAAADHPEVPYRVSPPLGVHAMLADVILERVAQA